MEQPKLKYAFFPGCVSKGACRELYDSTRIIAELLGIELVELEKASCCGAGVIQELQPKGGDALNARSLAMASQLGLPLLTQCSTCQGVFSQVQHRLKSNPDYLKEINNVLQHQGYSYNGKTDIKHLLWVLVNDYGLENVQKKIKYSLKGTKLAAFYGCYLLRPSSVMQFEKDPVHPTSMENIFTMLGAEPVMYDGRTKCCGFPISIMDKEASFRMAGANLLEAKKLGADAMVTPCPLCHLNLDARQPEVASFLKEKIDMPVLHLSQLVGLALGVEPKKLKLDKHIVDTSSFLKKFEEGKIQK